MAYKGDDRILVWDDCRDDLDRIERILQVINPKGCTADLIQSMVERAFYGEDGLDSYLGTGGWYVTVYPTSEVRGGQTVWRALPTLMAFTVARYLDLSTHTAKAGG